MFPLGDFSDKQQVRKLAEQYGFVNADKADSQDICFVRDGSFGDFIEDYLGITGSGDFTDTQGNVLGHHRGIYRYTKGQRRGLGIASDRPLYVCRKCPDNNTVVLSSEDGLYSKSLVASDFNWISGTAPEDWIDVQAKTRYNSKPSAAKAHALPNGSVEVVFQEPQRAVTEGQAVVLYSDDVVLGGGTIDEVN
jgi:tRNA-specific 2-thiouridylase